MDYPLVPREEGEAQGLTIVLDRTASMQHVLETLRQSLAVHIIRRILAGDPIAELGLVAFDDHYESDPLAKRGLMGPTVQPFGVSDNLEEYIAWLMAIELGDGADAAEAIACALAAARQLPTTVPHSIWLITDAVPHGYRAFVDDPSDYYSDDSFEAGCPCGTPLRLDDVHVFCLGRGPAEFFYQARCRSYTRGSLQSVAAALDLPEPVEEVSAP